MCEPAYDGNVLNSFFGRWYEFLRAKLRSIYPLQTVFFCVSECQKKYYNILNLVYSLTFWVWHGILAAPRSIYTEVLATAKFTGARTKF